MAEGRLSYDRLTSVLAYDAETGHFTWKEKRNNRTPAGKRAGCLDVNSQYRRLSVDNHIFNEHRIVWFYMTGRWPALMIDHINGDPSDNRFVNLRECTPRQNIANRACTKTSKSGIKGVRLTPSGKWQAIISLGTFDTIEEAKAVYLEAAQRLHGVFARTE